MKRIFILLLLTFLSTMHSQNKVDSIAIENNGDYKLEKLRDLSRKIFVVADIDEEKIYSVKFDNQNSFGIRFWVKTGYKYKKVRNKKGKWVDYKKKDYTMALINIDCSKREYEVLKIIDYDGNDKVVSSNEGDGTTEYIVPNSKMETFSSIICN